MKHVTYRELERKSYTYHLNISSSHLAKGVET